MILTFTWTLKSAQSRKDPSFFLCHTTGEAFMTPRGSTEAMIPCAWSFANSILTWSSMASGTFRARQKTGFASGFSLIMALTPSIAGKTFTSDWDALWMWSTRVTSLPINLNSFSESITATSTLGIFFSMGFLTLDDQDKAFCVHHMLQSIGG